MLLKTIPLILLAVFALRAEDDFTVKEVPTAELGQLRTANDNLEAATAAFAKAQQALHEAQSKRDGLMKDIASQFGAFEGECDNSSKLTNSYRVRSPLVFEPPVRKARRVEIRGRYALISEVSEQCGLWDTLTTGTLNTVNSITLPNSLPRTDGSLRNLGTR